MDTDKQSKEEIQKEIIKYLNSKGLDESKIREMLGNKSSTDHEGKFLNLVIKSTR